MPAASERLTAARREEIIDACAALYETMPFKKITPGEISKKTSFTRTSIYNYFRTKEEIFLALLEREYTAWGDDLAALARTEMPAERFPAAFAALLEKRKCMLKLLSMNLYDMEAGSRPENLVSFKRAYGRSVREVGACLEKHGPVMTDGDVQTFVYAFFPFLFGVYPYANASEKQRAAMEKAGVPYKAQTVAELTQPFVERWLQSFARAER